MSDKYAVILARVQSRTMSKNEAFDALVNVMKSESVDIGEGPDADGYYGSYRAMVEGVDPTVPGNPGYADYFGMGHTKAAADQVERNAKVNMAGGAIARQ